MDWRRISLSTVLGVLTPPVRRDGPTPVPGPGTAGGGTPGTGTPVDERTAARGLPVTLGGAPARQVDRTTCGSAVLVMLAATGDRALARWLEDGRLPEGLRPHEVPPEIPPALLVAPHAASAREAAARRFGAAQARVKDRTSARALGWLRWPGSLGTPPWTAAREARFPGVRYRSLPLDDRSDHAADLLASAHAATLAGVPVPLYTGGDLAGGAATAVPRHVVLAVPPPPGPGRGHDAAGRPALHIYEPASARVYRVPVADLLRRTGPHKALGGWSHVGWVLLPVPVPVPGAVASGAARGQGPQQVRRVEEER